MNASITTEVIGARAGGTPPSAAAVVSGLRVFLFEARSEFLRLLRAPSFSLPTIGFPLMFYVLFGVLLGPAPAVPGGARHALASFMVLGTMAPGLFALGITLAADREHRLLELKRALPMPYGAYLAAKMAMAMLFAAIVALLLMLVGVVAGGVVLTIVAWITLLVLSVLGVIPFCAIGLLVGALTRASATPAVLNLIYLPMSFLSGLFVPLSLLPHSLAQLAPLWPSWQLAQVARGVVGAGPTAGIGWHLLSLAATSAVCFAAAWRALSRPR